MTENGIKNLSLISRFSCSILGNGKKVSGHKIFLESLFISRQLLQKERVEKKNDVNLFNFLFSIGFTLERLENFLKSSQKKTLLKEQVQKSFYNKSLKNALNTKDLKSALQKKTLPLREKNGEIENDQKAKKDNNISENLSTLHSQTEIKSLLYSNLQRQPDLKSQSISNKKLCEKSRNNVKPILETRKVRKGRVTYRVPLVSPIERQEGKAVAWLVESACFRKNKTKLEKKENNLSISSKFFDDRKKIYRSIKSCLAEELLDALKEKGESFEKKKEFHKLALRNRAYTHYRWW